METRPTSMYRVPWQSARADRARPAARRPHPAAAHPSTAQPPAARPHRGTPDGPGSRPAASREAARDLRAGTPDMRWPSLSRQAPPGHIPVVGPTEALRGRPGGPGVDVPRGAVPGLLDHERESGWQLARRVWQDSGVDWEADAPEPDYGLPDPYAAHQYSAAPSLTDSYLADAGYLADADYRDGDYRDGDYPGDGDDPDSGYRADHDYRAIADPALAVGAADAYLADDPGPALQYSAAPPLAGRYLADRPATRPDLPVLRDPAEFPQGMGPWPVQQPAAAARPEPQAARREPPDPDGLDGVGTADRHRAPRGDGAPRPASAGNWGQPRGVRFADLPASRPRLAAAPDPGAAHDAAEYDPVAARDQGARAQGARDSALDQGAHDAPPPLPRRVRQSGAGWNEHPSRGPAGQAGPADRGQAPPPRPPAFAQASAFAPASPFAPSPAFASRQSLGASAAPHPARPLGAPPLSAPVTSAAPMLGEPDELFRAWQGSVREAAGQGTPWSPPRRRPRRGGGARGFGWQVAKIGVPAAVIVTVGAGALLMLTGRANEMLAERSSTGTQPSGQPGVTAATGSAGAATAGLTLAGYPGQHGSVGVAAMWSASGTTMAVGYADAHPAVWRHAANGTWSLVSATALGGLTGHLTSVAQETSGWIAVGSVSQNGTVEPVIFGSPDGATWTPLPTLTGIAGPGAQFLGVAAGPGGYLVVGKQGSGTQERAAFWWSADLKNWISGSGTGVPSSATAAAAVNNGFIAVGSAVGCHAIWLSADGQHWTEHDLAKPSGATSATLNSVAVDQAGRLVAGGVAVGGAADIPIVVSSADGGAHLTQAVLSAPQGPASVTAVTATSGGFVAVGLAGSGKAQRAVEWTSPDGVTWSAATPVSSAGTSQITALTGSGGTVTGTAQRDAGPSVLALPAR